MANDTVNGVALLLSELNDGLDGKRKLTRRELDYLQLRATKYLLEAIPPIRQNQEKLMSHDIIQRGIEHPKVSLFIVLFFPVLDIIINWATPRRYILQALYHLATGITLPLDNFW